MPSFTLCTGFSGRSDFDAAANWQALGLEQLVFGESPLAPSHLRHLLPEVRTNASDQPCLADLLGQAAERATQPWLLLVDGEARLTPALLSNLDQLCRPGRPPQLCLGRAWRLPQALLADPLVALEEERLNKALSSEGVLDPPEWPSWVLLPRGSFNHAPLHLGCVPMQSTAWLANQARRLGWPVLEATAAAPLLLPLLNKIHIHNVPLQARQVNGWNSCRDATGVVLPFTASAPRLSILLAAPQEQLDGLAQRLLPAASLPWEVIARPDHGSAAGPGSTAAAWNSALAQAKGDLVWPITAELPNLALIRSLISCFETPVVDLVHLTWSLGGNTLADDSAVRLQSGCLVGQRVWFDRLGGFNENFAGAECLRQFLARALSRGAHSQALPLPALNR